MKKIPLTQGKFAVVDDSDFEELSQYKWCYGAGFAVRGRKREGPRRGLISMHRELCPTGPRLQVEHIDGDNLNNQRHNLRAAMGGALRRRPQTLNKTGYKGVCKIHNKYIARISKDSVIHYIGIYSTAYDAARAYDKKSIEYYGVDAWVNITDEQAVADAQAKEQQEQQEPQQ